MNKNTQLVILSIAVILVAFYIIKSGRSEFESLENISELDPANFSATVSNPYFTLTPGKKWVYEAKSAEGAERVEMVVTNEKKKILGVETVVVWDRAWKNGAVVEDTMDWFAQDKEGNVWYFGEDSMEVLGGNVISRNGSWEAGVNGAKPGIIMKAEPKEGESYLEEYYQGVAEDVAHILSLKEAVTVPFGSFSDCLKTKNYTLLEPDSVEHKYYCPGPGNVVLETDEDGQGRLELVSVKDKVRLFKRR